MGWSHNDAIGWDSRYPEGFRLRAPHALGEQIEAAPRRDFKLPHSIDIFQDLLPEQLSRIDRSIKLMTCEPGQVFYAPEESGEALFILIDGRVQLYRLSPEGKKLVVSELGPGAIFGEMSLVRQGMYSAFAESASECTIGLMSREAVTRIIEENPAFALRFMEAIADRLRAVESKLEDLAFRDLPSRLAGLLLELSTHSPDSEFIMGYTHQDLADMLGTTRETTTQILSEFKATGWVQIRRKQIELTDKTALQNLRHGR